VYLLDSIQACRQALREPGSEIGSNRSVSSGSKRSVFAVRGALILKGFAAKT
jgi:hypothetical protein